jgi:nicotinamidase-related amidase
MASIYPQQTGLLLIDIQQGFSHPTHWGRLRSTPNFETNIEKLLHAFRQANSPIFHVCHHSPFEASPLHPSKPTAEFMPYAAPRISEPIFIKSTNSPFIETNLKQAIQESGVRRLVIVGLMTAHCVSTTVRMAANLDVVEHGYGIPDVEQTLKGRIVVAKDATATFDINLGGKTYDAETVHDIHLGTLKDEFCDLEYTDEVVRRLAVVD